MESSSSGGINTSSIVTTERKPFRGIRMENPFTFKVAQVFTGFGVGCGVGIGVGRPINLGAVPMLGQMMSATRGATDALSGVTRHVNDTMKKLGAKNIEAGIGCGVGFGHGFGVGLAIKPGVIQKIQSAIFDAMKKATTKLGISPDLATNGSLPMSLQSGMGMINGSTQNPIGNSFQMGNTLPDYTSQGLTGYGTIGSTYENFSSQSSSLETAFGSKTEKVLSNFLQNPVLKEEDTDQLNQLAGRLKSENNMLQMVLKHQQVIEELVEENEKLRHILVEDLKIPPSKLEASYPNRTKNPCTECFECRRKQRKSRWQ